MKMKTYYLNDYFGKAKRPPFPTGNDVIIVGRGEKNKDRFLFDLTRVTVFFLNYSPPQWAITWYMQKYPKIWSRRLFSFVHGSHLKDFEKIWQSKINVISWRRQDESQPLHELPGLNFKLTGLKTNNISIAAIDYLKKTLKKKTIYLCAIDFHVKKEWCYTLQPNKRRKWELRDRDFKIETRLLEPVIMEEHQNENKVLFVTFNPFFKKYMNQEDCNRTKKKLIESANIQRELTPDEVAREYERAGTALPKEPGVILREKYNESQTREIMIIRSTQKSWAEYQKAIWKEPLGNKKKISEKYKYNQFQGKRCFVVAGGPSLRGFDFETLKEEFTIGVNKICALFNPTIAYATDLVLFPFLLEHSGKNTDIVFCDRGNDYLNDVYYVRDRGLHGIPDSVDIIFSGDNSAYGAVNLAIAMGFEPIYLLGCDFKVRDSCTHVLDDWGHPGTPETYQREFLDKFRQEFEELARYSTRKIINLNQDSALQAFPKMNIDRLCLKKPYPLGIQTNGRRWRIGCGPPVFGTEIEAQRALEEMYRNRMVEL